MKVPAGVIAAEAIEVAGSKVLPGIMAADDAIDGAGSSTGRGFEVACSGMVESNLYANSKFPLHCTPLV